MHDIPSKPVIDINCLIMGIVLNGTSSQYVDFVLYCKHVLYTAPHLKSENVNFNTKQWA